MLTGLKGKTEPCSGFYDTVPIGCITIDRHGIIRRLNRMAADLIGVDPYQLINREFPLLISEEERPAFKSFLDRMFADTKKEIFEFTIINSSGTEIAVAISETISKDGEECFALLANVAEIRETGAALRESEMHHRALFENAGVAIVHLDAQGNFILVNNTFLEFIGYTREELNNMNVKDIIHPDYIEQTRKQKEKQMNGKIDQFAQEKYYV